MGLCPPSVSRKLLGPDCPFCLLFSGPAHQGRSPAPTRPRVPFSLGDTKFPGRGGRDFARGTRPESRSPQERGPASWDPARGPPAPGGGARPLPRRRTGCGGPHCLSSIATQPRRGPRAPLCVGVRSASASAPVRLPLPGRDGRCPAVAP